MLRGAFCVAFSLCLAGSFALYEEAQDLLILDSNNFDTEVMNSNDVWLVEFYAPWCGHCKNLAPAWAQAAKKLKGVVKVAAVNADVDRSLGERFQVTGYPTIKVFKSPVVSKMVDGKKKAHDFNGGRTTKSIVDAAVALLPKKTVAKIDSTESLNKFLENPLPKALLFSEKRASPPLFTALSLEFHKRIAFGVVHSSAKDVTSKLNVNKFPTVVYIPSSLDTAIVYDGDLKADGLALFFAGQETVTEDLILGSGEVDEEADEKPAEEAAEEPVEVVEITTNEQLFEFCGQKKSLCLLSFLDPLADPTGQEKYLKTLQEVAERAKEHFSVVWIDSAKQPDFFAHFQPTDLPCLRVWNRSKGVGANVVASLTTDSISRFLQDVLSGRARTGKLQDPPAIVAGGVARAHEEL